MQYTLEKSSNIPTREGGESVFPGLEGLLEDTGNYDERALLWWSRRANASGSLTLALNVVSNLVYLVENVAVAIYQVRDFGVGVQNGGVVTAPEGTSDLGERFVGQLSTEIHGDLPRICEGLGAAGPDEVSL